MDMAFVGLLLICCGATAFALGVIYAEMMDEP